MHSAEVRFASLLSDGFTTVAVINPPEKKLAKRTSVQWFGIKKNLTVWYVSLVYLTKVQVFQVQGRAQIIILMRNVFYGWILGDFLVRVIARFPYSASKEGFRNLFSQQIGIN